MIHLSETHIRGIKLYLSNIFVYGLLLLFLQLPSYPQNVSSLAQKILFGIFLLYLVIGPFYYLLFATRYSENKSYILLTAILRTRLKNNKRWNKKERVATLFFLVKIFFLPLMVTFVINNVQSLLSFERIVLFPFIITAIFAIDTLIFSFGYMFEFRSLNNVVKSVEPTVFGWAVALISYPPFNSLTGKYIAWGANDHVFFWNSSVTVIMRILVIFFLGVYLWATFALGAKASNLTNRGIVTKFPYSIIRHPAYISKNLVWWLTLLPVINMKFALGMLFWSTIYFLRAITEENHLSRDPDYKKYRQKVKYRFIPFIY